MRGSPSAQRAREPMLERLPYFRLHPADYLLDTQGLSLEAHGIYCLLMFTYYWNGSLPQEREELETISLCKTDAQRAELDRVLSRFFKLEGDLIVHRRIDRELEKMRAFFDKQHRAADASVAARAQKSSQPKAPRNNGAHFTPPDWVIVSKWDAWVKIRPAKARTPEALSAAIEKLEKWRAAGHDGNAIIANSLANGWQGLFAPDAKRGGGAPTLAERNRAAGEEFLRRGSQQQEEKEIK